MSSIKNKIDSDSSGSEGESNRQGFYVGGSNQRFYFISYIILIIIKNLKKMKQKKLIIFAEFNVFIFFNI